MLPSGMRARTYHYHGRRKHLYFFLVRNNRTTVEWPPNWHSRLQRHIPGMLVIYDRKHPHTARSDGALVCFITADLGYLFLSCTCGLELCRVLSCVSWLVNPVALTRGLDFFTISGVNNTVPTSSAFQRYIGVSL